jgi:predicted AlkP superfamily phosphohydrolase/phosphomutase
MRRGILVALASLLCLVLAGVTPGCRRHAPLGRRVIVLGFDGLDYDLTRDLMARGRLPHFSALAKSGGFAPLGTTIPPQSPVAWSSFITGLDPGGHGIYDFVHRDPATLAPFLSTSRTVPPSRFLSLGRYQLPLSAGRVELLRKGQAFWERLEEAGIETTIVRMPANFPPSGTATRELSGMGTPDLLGTYGTFSFYSSDPFVLGGQVSGGVYYSVSVRNGVVRSVIEGPDDSLLKAPVKLRTDLVVHVDPSRTFAKIVVGDEQRLVRVGEWSDWVPVRFALSWGDIGAQVRFYLKSLAPEFQLYASPLNVDPLSQALPVSSPSSYAAELARATGRFYTQGMPEDTKALKAGAFTIDEFLGQARLAEDEVERQYDDTLSTFADGFLFYYVGNVDQVSHMLWRPMDPGHPAYDAAADAPYAHAVEDLYVRLDAIVGRTLPRLGPDDLLVVMSDHGFTSWRRSFNLNTWLRDHGYLRLRRPLRPGESAAFEDIDWTGTKAYGLGLNGLYVNVRGRERSGIVDPAERDAVAREIAAKLLATIDPVTGTPAVTRVSRREDSYQAGRDDGIAPDLVVGYAKGTRASDDSALGGVAPDVLVDNRSEWTGDHCMDPAAVPGILLTNRPLRKKAPGLGDLAASLLAEMGVEGFPAVRKEH